MSAEATWTPAEVLSLRTRLCLDEVDFAAVMGVDSRTVHRWETGEAAPQGASVALLSGTLEALDRFVEQEDRIRKYLRRCADMGGLAYAWMRLLEGVR